MFFFLYLMMIYITRWSILAQMNAFYLEVHRKTSLLIEGVRNTTVEQNKWLKESYPENEWKLSKGNRKQASTTHFTRWFKYSWPFFGWANQDIKIGGD